MHPVMVLFITATFCGIASGKSLVDTFSSITSYFGSTLGSIGVMIIFGAVFAAGISVMLATVLLYVPGIFVYAKGQKEKGLKVFETKVDKAVFVALLALLGIYFVGTGRINPLG